MPVQRRNKRRFERRNLTLVRCQSDRINDRRLINVATENNRHLNITALKSHGFEASSLEFTPQRNVTWQRRGSYVEREIGLTAKKYVNLICKHLT